jgi:peptide/nickel transport system substrate-binding protein
VTIHSRLAAGIGTAAVVGMLVSGCSGGPSTPAESYGEPQRGGTLTYAFNSDAQSVDPAVCAIGVGMHPCQAIYGALMYYNLETREFEPGMAESFSTEDGKVWTLKLRPGMTFTDGTPFDAQAVAFNWQRILEPALLSRGATVAKTLSWQVVDPVTVQVVSNETNYQLPLSISEDLAFIGSPAAITEKGADYGSAPVGAGPFTLTSWARGTEMTLDRNPNYWDQPRPYVDRLVIKTVPADDQRFNALQAGELDVMSVTLDKYADRAESAGMNVTHVDLLGGTGFRMSSRGVLADADLRTAIDKLVDNEQIMNAVYPGEPVATGFTPEDSPLYGPGSEWPDRDVAGAQALIDGHRARNGGAQAEIDLNVSAGSTALTQVGELLQSQLQQINGLKLNIVPLDGSAYASALNSGNYDMIITNVGGAHFDNLYKVFHTKGASNGAGFSSPVVDEALNLTRTSGDPAVVDDAYKSAINEIVASSTYRFWRHAKSSLLSANSVHGVQPVYQYWIRPDLAWIQ